jgi:hypothetical protein
MGTGVVKDGMKVSALTAITATARKATKMIYK